MEQVDIGIAPSRYRLPPKTRLGRVRLQVSDLGRSRAFYQTILGLRELAEEDGTVMLGSHADDVPVVELVERKGARPVPRRGLLGLFHVAILLPDRASLGAFLGHLGKAGHPIGMSDHHVSEAIYLNDPDSLGIEVYADRPREAWGRAGREIRMTTEPLDVEDLLRAAGEETWSGAPAGTRIGHVHLHVGDLTRAASFYHDGLGFDKIVWSYPGALFLSAGGYHHHVGINTWAADARPAGPEDARLLNWTIVMPDQQALEEASENLTSAGFTVSTVGVDVRALDPWGTAVLLSTRA